MEENIKNALMYSGKRLLIGIAFTVGAVALVYESTSHPINWVRTSQVQSGYIRPVDLELRLEDTDGDGIKETVLVVKGKDGKPDQKFYLRYNPDGKPSADPFYVDTTLKHGYNPK